MRNILLTVSYDGTRFCGWQKQQGVRTVEVEDPHLLVVLIPQLGLHQLHDVGGRVLIRPDEMEAGIVTAFIGGPVLLAMVIRRSEAGAQ